MTTRVDVHRELYRLAAELRDGADADAAAELREFADSFVPLAAEEVGGTYTSTPVAPNTSLEESDVRRNQVPDTNNPDVTLPASTGDASLPEDKTISRRGDAGNTASER